jgi:protein phosphatase
VDAALEGGAPDNVTCVVAEVYDSDATDGPSRVAAAGLLVGAATDDALGGNRPAGAGDALTEQPDRRLHDPEDDDEELMRYAPRTPSRFRWLGRAGVVVLALALLAGAAYAAFAWTRTQYYTAWTAIAWRSSRASTKW